MNLKNRIDEVNQLYENAIEKIALEQFEEYIKPYCIKRNLIFLSGNGTFGFWPRNGSALDVIDSDDLPKRIKDILYTSTINPNWRLSDFMPDYDP